MRPENVTLALVGLTVVALVAIWANADTVAAGAVTVIGTAVGYGLRNRR